MNTSRERQVVKAANRCRMAVKINPEIADLYGYNWPMLDSVATLRRVALLLTGSGRYTLTPDERRVALDVLDERFDSYELKCRMGTQQ